MIGLAYLALGASVFFLVGWILAVTARSQEADGLRRELMRAHQLLYENEIDYEPDEGDAFWSDDPPGTWVEERKRIWAQHVRRVTESQQS